jgi:hypothetical protein
VSAANSHGLDLPHAAGPPQNEGAVNFGLPMKVDPYYRGDLMVGFTITVIREGVTLTQLGVWFDDKNVSKREWVGRGPDGFPVLEGRTEEVLGRSLEVRCGVATWHFSQSVSQSVSFVWRCCVAGWVVPFLGMVGLLHEPATQARAVPPPSLKKVPLVLCSMVRCTYRLVCNVAGNWMTTPLTSSSGTPFVATALAWLPLSTSTMHLARAL